MNHNSPSFHGGRGDFNPPPQPQDQNMNRGSGIYICFSCLKVIPLLWNTVFMPALHICTSPGPFPGIYQENIPEFNFGADFPPAPGSINLREVLGGVWISWETPRCPLGGIDFLVDIAVAGPAAQRQEFNGAAGIPRPNLNFFRVYTGILNQCIVPNAIINEALDRNAPSGVIFRLAARNNRGCGPPSFVRYPQDRAQYHRYE